jgi:cell division protein FtsI/penicillin-binding protein 2
MKIFTYATALEFNLVSPTELVDCENGACLFHEGQIQRVIRDFHPIGVVPCAQAFAESSNIAAVKIGLRIAPRLFHEQLAKLGLVDRVGLGLPEKEGHLTDLRKWSYLTRTSVPFGYEISANSAQLLACASAIANGGLKMAPRLARRIISPRGETVQTFEPKALGRVFSEHTCQIMMELMEGVVQRGTGKSAAVEGYRVAGKTGTAKKHDPDNRRYVASFVGFLPVCDPRLAIFCWIDEPATESDEYTGGRAAAPVFRAVAEQAVRLRGIRPDGALASPEPQIALDNGPRQPPAQAETRIKVRGVMPNLIGMTMREVQEALGALHEAAPETKLRTRFYGSGVVVRQDPQPETPLASQQQCSIHFSRRLNDGDRAAPLESRAPDLDKLSQGG